MNTHRFGWDYPSGVRGDEPEIAGYPRCGKCSHEADDHKNLVGPDGKACWIEDCNCDGYSQERDDPAEERARDGAP